eukprot:scaffold1290_cov367-Prasinococcus_capsulatus_cf.AAC.11
MESKKHAARRPRPPFPSAASVSSCCKSSSSYPNVRRACLQASDSSRFSTAFSRVVGILWVRLSLRLKGQIQAVDQVLGDAACKRLVGQLLVSSLKGEAVGAPESELHVVGNGNGQGLRITPQPLGGELGAGRFAAAVALPDFGLLRRGRHSANRQRAGPQQWSVSAARPRSQACAAAHQT